MNEEERKALEKELQDLAKQARENKISPENLGRLILSRAAKIKEMKADPVYFGTNSYGRSGYQDFCNTIRNSTFNEMQRALFAGMTPNPGTTIRAEYEKGYRGDELLERVISSDRTGVLAANRGKIKNSIGFIIQAAEFDNESVDYSYQLASDYLYGYKFQEENPDELQAILNKNGIAMTENPDGSHEKSYHNLLVKETLSKMKDPVGVPRWAQALFRKPGMDAAEKQKLVDTWNSGNAGKQEICSLFISEIESLDPAMLEINSLEDYVKNFDENCYYGGLTFDAQKAFGDFSSYGLKLPPERAEELQTVYTRSYQIFNRFISELGILEHPWGKYITNIDDVSREQVAALMLDLQSVKGAGNKASVARKEATVLTAALGYHNDALDDLKKESDAGELLAHNRKYSGDERSRQIDEWYAKFKKTMEAEGIDLSDPAAMARVQAVAPGKESNTLFINDQPGSTVFMPAMKGMNENFYVKDRPAFADVTWYKENLTAANDLSREQITNLYDLAMNGRLAIYGKSMSEDSLRTVYSNTKGELVLSVPLSGIDAAEFGSAGHAAARELFPDSPDPYKTYVGACELRRGAVSEASLSDNEELARAEYNRMIMRDYFENTGRYENDPRYAEDRAARAYVISRYKYADSDQVRKEYEEKYDAYIAEETNAAVPEDKEAKEEARKQEEALRSINDSSLTDIKIPRITEEMFNFVNSIPEALKEKGYDMELFTNKAGLRFFTNDNGTVKSYPAYAPLDFKNADGGYYLAGSEREKDPQISDAEDFVLRNTCSTKFNENAVKNSSIVRVNELIRIALIYENAKKGQLLFTAPGQETTHAFPVIPGEDGKAVAVADFDALAAEKRKDQYYVNASRVRRLNNDPQEEANVKYLKEHTKKLDPSCYEIKGSSFAIITGEVIKQAKAKGINDKQEFIDQAIAVTPKVNISFSDFINKCNESLEYEGEAEIRFKPRRISSGQTAARKALSESARRAYFGTQFELNNFDVYANEAVKRNLVSREEADVLSKMRGLFAVFLDRGTAPDAMENNVEAIRVLAKGSPEEKVGLFNKCLAKFSGFDSSKYYGLSDAQLVEKWPEIDENMYRLQELIRINKDLENKNIIGDPDLIKSAMKSERESGDIYLYLTNRLQAIANPAYENVDVDQLMSTKTEDALNAISSMSDVEGSKIYRSLAGNLSSAMQGMQLAAATNISNLMMDKFNAADNKTDFYDKDGNTLGQFDVYNQLIAGKEVYAALKGQDEVAAFKAEKGSFKAAEQPSGKYAKKIASLKEERVQKRREEAEKKARAEEERRKREEEKKVREASEAAAKEKADALMDDVANADIPDDVPEKPLSEADKIREVVQAELKENIEYQQYLLNRIVNSYGPEGALKERTDDYRNFTRECVTELLALTKLFEESGKADITVDKLKSLTDKNTIASVRSVMEKDDAEALKMTLDILDENMLANLSLSEDEAAKTPDIKLNAADDLYSEFRKNAAEVNLKKEKEAAEKLERERAAAEEKEKLERENAEREAAEKKEQMKVQAEAARNSGIGKYKSFSDNLSKVIDEGLRNLAFSAQTIDERRDSPVVRHHAMIALSELFIAVTVKDVVDNKNLTYRQIEGLASPKALKNAANDVMADPAFGKFCDMMFNSPKVMAEVAKEKPNEKGEHELLNSLFESYKSMSTVMSKGANAKKNKLGNDQPKNEKNKSFSLK